MKKKDFPPEMSTKNRLREVRLSVGLSQGDLAARAGVSRQTVGAIEANLYGLSLAVALRLSKALGKKLEDVFWLQENPAPELLCQWSGIGSLPDKGAPIQIVRSGIKHNAYPVSRETLGLEANAIVTQREKGRIRANILAAESLDQQTILLAGCSPVLGLLRQRLNNIYRDVSWRWVNTNSTRALEALKNGFVHMAGVHIFDEQTGEYNLPVVRRVLEERPYIVINVHHGEQGFLVRRDNPKGIIHFDDLLRGEVQMVNRETGAESRRILDAGLRSRGIIPQQVAGYDFLVGTHQEVAQTVAFGGADCGLALRSMTRFYDLDFLPLTRERFDLVILREYLNEPGVQAVLDFLQKKAVQFEIESCGYEPEATGREIQTT